MVAEMFIRTSKDKSYKKMTANDSKSYLGYLKKLVDQYNNTYIILIIILLTKNLLMLIILL